MLTLDKVLIKNGDFRLKADMLIPRGASVAVIGPSGGGKSTLLGAIAGFNEVAEGSITWNGAVISDLPPHKRPMAILFQDNNFFPHLTVAQNVGLGLDPSLKLTVAQRRLVSAALEKTGLHGYEERKPGSLSGGQQGRVALARVLVQQREIILLDEPFAALGPALKTEMLTLVQDLTREIGATLLMVSHEPEDARLICEQTVLVAEGAATGPFDTAKLLADPPQPLREYLGANR
mgnify:CR=1 FL=1